MSHPGHFTLLQSFAYWTSCAIASYEVAASKKKTSKSDLDRLHNIAKEMVEDLRKYTPVAPNSAQRDYQNIKATQEYDDCIERLKKAEEDYTQEQSA